MSEKTKIFIRRVFYIVDCYFYVAYILMLFRRNEILVRDIFHFVVWVLCNVSILCFVFNIWTWFCYFLLSFSSLNTGSTLVLALTSFIFILLYLLVFGSIFVELSIKFFIAHCYPYRLTTQTVAKILRKTSGLNSPQQRRRIMFVSVYFREYVVFKVQPARSPDLNPFDFCGVLNNPNVFKVRFWRYILPQILCACQNIRNSFGLLKLHDSDQTCPCVHLFRWTTFWASTVNFDLMRTEYILNWESVL